MTLYTQVNLSEKDKLEIYKKYITRIRKLAYRGNSVAQYDLAQHYEDIGYFGNPNPYFNNGKRFYWYFKSADNKNGAACNNLCDLFERGDGCQVDLKKALDYYKKSMEFGDVLGKKNYKKMLKDLKEDGIYGKMQ